MKMGEFINKSNWQKNDLVVLKWQNKISYCKILDLIDNCFWGQLLEISGEENNLSFRETNIKLIVDCTQKMRKILK